MISEPVEQLVLLMEDAGWVVPVREYRFHPVRKWRIDLYLKEFNVGIECQGGVHRQGRHTRGKGYTDDCRKLNEAQLLGITLLWVTPEMIENGEALDFISRAISRS